MWPSKKRFNANDVKAQIKLIRLLLLNILTAQRTEQNTRDNLAAGVCRNTNEQRQQDGDKNPKTPSAYIIFTQTFPLLSARMMLILSLVRLYGKLVGKNSYILNFAIGLLNNAKTFLVVINTPNKLAINIRRSSSPLTECISDSTTGTITTKIMKYRTTTIAFDLMLQSNALAQMSVTVYIAYYANRKLTTPWHREKL